MSFFHLNTLLLALALFSFCIKADPPPSCSNTSHWLSKDLTENSMNLTVFQLSFLSNHSLSFTFTSTYGEEDDAPAVIILINMRPQPAASFDHSNMQSCTRKHFTLSEPLLPHVCNPLPQQIQAAPTDCSSEPDPYDSGERHFKHEALSLTYNAETATLHVEENFYQDGLKPNKTVEVDLQPDAVPVSNENITLFVAYITSGEARINFTTKESTVDTPSSEKLMDPDVNIDHDNAKSNQIKVVVWVIVGVSMMGLLMGLLILVLFIKKRRRGRSPSLVLSRPPAGHGVPPSATSRAPFDLESSETPMMRALPLSPPYTKGFETSGTASWLKQPNPR